MRSGRGWWGFLGRKTDSYQHMCCSAGSLLSQVTPPSMTCQPGGSYLSICACLVSTLYTPANSAMSAAVMSHAALSCATICNVVLACRSLRQLCPIDRAGGCGCDRCSSSSSRCKQRGTSAGSSTGSSVRPGSSRCSSRRWARGWAATSQQDRQDQQQQQRPCASQDGAGAHAAAGLRADHSTQQVRSAAGGRCGCSTPL